MFAFSLSVFFSHFRVDHREEPVDKSNTVLKMASKEEKKQDPNIMEELEGGYDPSSLKDPKSMRKLFRCGKCKKIDKKAVE